MLNLDEIQKIPKWKMLALERILKTHPRNFDLGLVGKIIDFYVIFDGSAERAMNETNISANTFLKYWGLAGFKLRKRGERGKNRTKSSLYLQLLDKGLSSEEIASEIIDGKEIFSSFNQQAEIKISRKNKRKKIGKKLASKIIELANLGFTRREIRYNLGRPSEQGLINYLKRHPDLPRPFNDGERRYFQIKFLINAGLKSPQITSYIGYSTPSGFFGFLEDHAELEREYKILNDGKR